MPVFNRTRFLVVVLFMTSFCGSSNTLAASASQPEKFTNIHIKYKTTWRDMWKVTKRFHRAPISLEDMPQLDAVIISHDHYDHLDKGSIEVLINKVSMFITLLRVGNHLRDSGYFEGFKAIGDKYGPFDLSMIETGAYNELWSDIHMLPAESLQAHIDIQANVMMPVHNSTFDLALHNWNEPLIRITKLAGAKEVPVSIPTFGEIVPIKQSGEVSNKVWWLDEDNT